MLKRVDMEKRLHVENELKENLKYCEKVYAKGQELLESLQKEKKYRAIKLGTTKTKARELDASKETLKSSLEDTLRSKRELEGEVFELKDYLVETMIHILGL